MLSAPGLAGAWDTAGSADLESVSDLALLGAGVAGVPVVAGVAGVAGG